MTAVGVDLAWGRRARTGLCVADARGRVRASTTVVSDEEILAWLAREAPHPVVVGFDAPLVVNNPTGRRRCETVVSHVFGAQRAGAHSSNLSMPVFAGGGRAMSLTRGLGLSTDPTQPLPPDGVAPGAGLAVEVYPHSALVATFGLAERPVYKAGRGRTVEVRRAGLAGVIALIESLAGASEPFDVTTNPSWRDLADQVRRAERHVHLEMVEDEIDAHVCAYVALQLSRDLADGGARVRVLGDWADGAVVTPVDSRHVALLDAGGAATGEGPPGP